MCKKYVVVLKKNQNFLTVNNNHKLINTQCVHLYVDLIFNHVFKLLNKVKLQLKNSLVIFSLVLFFKWTKPGSIFKITLNGKNLILLHAVASQPQDGALLLHKYFSESRLPVQRWDKQPGDGTHTQLCLDLLQTYSDYLQCVFSLRADFPNLGGWRCGKWDVFMWVE